MHRYDVYDEEHGGDNDNIINSTGSIVLSAQELGL